MVGIDDRRAVRPGVLAVLVIGLLVAGAPTGTWIRPLDAATSVVPEKYPVLVGFDLTHEKYVLEGAPDAWEIPSGVVVTERGTVMTTDRFEWWFNGYEDWTLTKVCCPDPLYDIDDSGWSRRVTPQGEILFREGPESEWELVGTYQPAEGRTPLPELGPRRPGAVRVEVPDGEAPWARLGVRADSVERYQTGFLMVDWYVPLGLPIQAIEVDEQGRVVRTLVVTSIERGS